MYPTIRYHDCPRYVVLDQRLVFIWDILLTRGRCFKHSMNSLGVLHFNEDNVIIRPKSSLGQHGQLTLIYLSQDNLLS